MKRYCMSPIIGNGSENDDFRAAVADLANIGCNAVIPTGTNGHPLFNFALCRVGGQSMASVAAVSNVYVCPDLALDSRMDSMEPAARVAFQQSLEAYDLDGNGLHLDVDHDDDESYRQVLLRVVQQMNPLMTNLDNWDATENVE